MRVIIGAIATWALFFSDYDLKFAENLLYELKKTVIIKVSQGLSPLESYSNKLTGTRSELVYGRTDKRKKQ